MAGKVGLKEEEYTSMAGTLTEVHADSIQQLEQALNQLESLNTSGGGFYTSQLSPKINLVIKEIRSMSSSIESVFTAHETVVTSFQNAIANCDVCS